MKHVTFNTENKIPAHIAIIPDGNRRWAKEKGLPIFEGHRKGFKQSIDLCKKARDLGIKILTLWAFSTENWKRDQKEINYLMKLYEIVIEKFLKEALKNEIRLVHLGRKDRISKSLREKIENAEEKTNKFEKYYLAIALDYGGRNDIVRAIKKMTNDKFQMSNLSENTFNLFLDTKDLPYPNPDLIIRTGGDKRTSGFLLWQSEYAEYIFSDKYFPDFSPKDLENCVNEFMQRQRRFGK